MECIHCTQCIDACDAVMDNIGLEPGLISYTSQAELETGKRSFLRPRLVVYSAILLVMFGAFARFARRQEHRRPDPAARPRRALHRAAQRRRLEPDPPQDRQPFAGGTFLPHRTGGLGRHHPGRPRESARRRRRRDRDDRRFHHRPAGCVHGRARSRSPCGSATASISAATSPTVCSGPPVQQVVDREEGRRLALSDRAAPSPSTWWSRWSSCSSRPPTPSYAVEEDYYQKAIDWDLKRAQDRANDDLGWLFEFEVTPPERPGDQPLVEVTLRDAVGVPLTGATIAIEAFHNSSATTSCALPSPQPASPGSTAPTMPMQRNGRWEMRFTVDRGGQEFTEHRDPAPVRRRKLAMTGNFGFRISDFGFSTIHPGFLGRAEPNPKSEIRNPKFNVVNS